MKKLISVTFTACLLACQFTVVGQLRSTAGMVRATSAASTSPALLVLNSYTKKNGNTTLTLYKGTADKTTKPAENKAIATSNETVSGNTVCRTETRRYTAETMAQEILSPEAVNNIKLGAVYSLVKMQTGDYSTIATNRAPVDTNRRIALS